MALMRHKRDTDARRTPRAPLMAGAAAVLVTAAAVMVGVSLQDPSSNDLVAADTAASSATLPSSPALSAAQEAARDREHVKLSRSMNRRVLALQEKARLRAAARAARVAARTTFPRWTTSDLNLWTLPGEGAESVDMLPAGKKVGFAGRTVAGRDEIVVGGAIRWVTHGYLSKHRPDTGPAALAGLSDAPCPDSSVERGLAADTIRLYRAVCHAFPQVKDYLGWGPREEHDTGHAIDVMVYGDKALGDAVAAWAQEHATELNLYDILWYHRIWTPARASEGWRTFADRGSPTANHMDHVHLGTN